MMQQRFFISDLHYNHVACCERFRNMASVEAMNDHIITSYNAVVGPKDLTYILGDVAWHNAKELLDRLNGYVVIVRGNHDSDKEWKTICTHKKVQVAKEGIYRIKIDGEDISLCHFAMASWNRSCHGAWHIHGHHHDGWTLPEGKIMNVTADHLKFTPVSFDLVRAAMTFRSNNYDYVPHARKDL